MVRNKYVWIDWIATNWACDQIVQVSKARDNWSETTTNYWMMVERYPNLKEEVGGSNPRCKISSLHDGKTC